MINLATCSLAPSRIALSDGTTLSLIRNFPLLMTEQMQSLWAEYRKFARNGGGGEEPCVESVDYEKVRTISLLDASCLDSKGPGSIV